nr:hypothetical protein [Natranaerofaba carboxydovora]
MFESRQYILDNKTEETLNRILSDRSLRGKINFSNARLVRNMVEASIRRQALRLMNKPEITRQDLLYITKDDLVFNQK